MTEGSRDREQAVRERAYAIWLDEGQPEGRSEDHWHRANADLDAEEAIVTPLTDLGGHAAPLVTPVR